jgi:hypothetical protein
MPEKPQTLITWYLKALRTPDNADYKNSSYSNWIMSPSTIDTAMKILCKMNYNIQEYELITHHDYCMKWSVVFNLGDEDYDDFRRVNMKTLIQFKYGSYITSSIYVKHKEDLDDDLESGDGDDFECDDSSEDEWEKIYKNKNC